MIKCYLFLAIQLLATLAYSQNYHINEDFNNSSLPSGWTTNAVSGSQTWSFGIDGANAHASNQNIDGTPMAFFDDDVLGQASNNNTAELITPSFNNSGEPYTYLTFEYNFRQAIGIPDSFYVDVFDGNQWQRIFDQEQDSCGNYLNCSSFPTAFIDITAYANPNCQVRFTYHDGNNWGWYLGLDNVQIWSPYANDLSVAELIQPMTGCGLSATDSIQVLIVNQGYQTQQSFDIAFELNGSPAVIETVTDSIAYQDSLIYTFSNTGNFSRVGQYNLKAYTLLSNDSNLTNDTVTIQITNDTIHQLPYFNNFENSNNGWIASGANSSWAWGVPSNNLIDTAYSGQNAWVTNLNGDYNSYELSYLTSPCFDFSNLTKDPILSFQLNHETEFYYDKLWLEYSTNSGQHWQKVPKSNNAYNWYNISSRLTWEESSNGWIKTTNLLEHLAGEPKVKFRFVFESDGGTQYEGVGIDDFAITKRSNYDLSIDQLIYPSNTSLCGLGSSVSISQTIKNYGLNKIDSFKVFYQIDQTPLDSENVIQSIDTLSSYTHISKLKFDLSQAKSYFIKTWIEALGDANHFNDTLTTVVENSIVSSNLSLPYNENFKNFNNGAANQNGWSATPIAQNINAYGWRANSGMTSSFSTGPVGDHTLGHGKYIYLEGNQLNGSAIFESPCIEFSAYGAVLSFWYHRYGNDIEALHIDYYNGQKWVNVKTITNKQYSSYAAWKFEKVLLPLSGAYSKIRFRGSSSTCCASDVAIDDVKIERNHIGLQTLTDKSSCKSDDQLEVKVNVYNYSLSALAADSLFLSYAIDNSIITADTITQSLASNTAYIHTFSDSIDLNQYPNQFEVKVIAQYTDTSVMPTTELSYHYRKSEALLDFIEDFESYPLKNYDSTIWLFDKNWKLINDTVNNNNNFPALNKTPGGNQFFRTENQPQLNAKFESRCIDVSQIDSLYLSFWFKHSRDIAIYLYLHSNGSNLQRVDSIYINRSSNWKKAIFNLTPYLNNTSLELGIETYQYSGYKSVFAVDDIQLISKPNPYNVRAKELLINQNCNTNSTNLELSIENNGIDSIPYTQFKAYYQLDNQAIITDSFSTSIGISESYTHRFNQPLLNLLPNQNYTLKAWIEKAGDSLKSDDSLLTSFTYTGVLDSLNESFEQFEDVNCLSGFNDQLKNGWYSPNQRWSVRDLEKCFNLPIDHNLDTGTYLIADNFNISNDGKVGVIYSPCIDISMLGQPVLSYWLFKMSYETFKVEVLTNGVWQIIDSTSGLLQNGTNQPWVLKTVNLTPYKNNTSIQLRFSVRIRSYSPDLISIDDVSISDSLVSSISINNKSTNNFILYPNPSIGQFTLDVGPSFLGESYQIHELLGKVVQEGKITSSKTRIQLPKSAKGIYFLSIPDRNVREKVVVY